MARRESALLSKASRAFKALFTSWPANRLGAGKAQQRRIGVFPATLVGANGFA
jgi:hypothetical protein